MTTRFLPDTSRPLDVPTLSDNALWERTISASARLRARRPISLLSGLGYTLILPSTWVHEQAPKR